jgi:DnaJ-class molecular chaperone
VSVELAVTDKDFGSTQTARLECEWYCHRCRRGGQRSYSRCPRCEETTARNYSMPVKVKLRAWRKYGDYIRCTRSGYCDVPFAPPGDVLVRIVRRDEAGVGA